MLLSCELYVTLPTNDREKSFENELSTKYFKLRPPFAMRSVNKAFLISVAFSKIRFIISFVRKN